MPQTIRQQAARTPRPIRILQFGEGNFLRAFADYMIDVANERGVFDGDVAVVKAIRAGSLKAFREQDNLYTVCLRGKLDGAVAEERRIVTCIGRVLDAYEDYEDYMALAELESLELVISNTTEAGIVLDRRDRRDQCPPESYPAKLTQFLYARYCHFGGDSDKGLIILPVELIENNGGKLKECVAQCARDWELEPGFMQWIVESCTFCSTLVDRIVTGYPGGEAEALFEQWGYQDRLLAAAEPFGLWVIESDKDISSRFPLDRAGLPVVFTRDQRPYRERKVRILNGAHTATVLAAFLAGQDTVGGLMADPLLRRLIEESVRNEILPTVRLPREEVEVFAAAVFERFENPFVSHALLSISLNSVSKWKARVLPSLKDSHALTGQWPRCLTFSYAALLAFYAGAWEGGKLLGCRDGAPYEIMDSTDVLEFFGEAAGSESSEYTARCAARLDFWGENLNELPGFVEQAGTYLEEIRQKGMAASLEALLR